MDAINDPDCEIVVMMTSSQIGKTEIINNICGYYIDHDPSTILMVQPTVEMGETWSKTRLSPMIRDTPCLFDKVGEASSRKSGNTIRQKAFPGGHITVSGANAPAGLASRPIRIVLIDEADRAPISAGSEGDPIALAIQRSTTYWNRKIVIVSTPTIKHASRIEQWYDQSSRERRHLACHACGHAQVLALPAVRWEPDQPETARYECVECGAAWSDWDILRADRTGEWIAEDPTQKRIRGFHLNELISPWVTLEQTARKFLEAKHIGPERLRTFVNLALGESWEEEGSSLDPALLYRDRRRPYDKIPIDAHVLVAGADVQKDRIEVELLAVAPDRRTWSMDYRVLYGDPNLEVSDPDSPWSALDAILAETYAHENGEGMRVRAAMIDAGYLPDAVLPFCRARLSRLVFACRGDAGEGKSAIHRLSRNNPYRCPVYYLGIDGIKAEIYRDLTVEEGAGACLFPHEYPRAYFEQLVSEYRREKRVGGFIHHVWELPPNARNESLDCRVYARAAYERIVPRRSTLVQRETAPMSAQKHDKPSSFGELGPFTEGLL
jgi:phage terminase large subunit GpA-like protein